VARFGARSMTHEALEREGRLRTRCRSRKPIGGGEPEPLEKHLRSPPPNTHSCKALKAYFGERTFHALGSTSLSPLLEGEALRRESSISYLRMEPIFAPVPLWA
jgi:hypothetical protein